MLLIPEDDKIHIKLANLCRTAKVIVFVGLPGTGKSLYINHLYRFTEQESYLPQLIQWDVCRKEFEKGELKSRFPNNDGQVHPGVRLSAGNWLLSFLKNWCVIHLEKDKNRLLIEAPLVGHRFSELCHMQDNTDFEQLLRSDQIQFILPIPNNEVRSKIESDRIAQVSETAQNWSGAKPSVMVQLWKDTLAIARELGLTSYEDDGYQADIYESTYKHILRHRQTTVLNINKTYDVIIQDESALHSLKNESPSQEEVMRSISQTVKAYPTKQHMIAQINNWYKN